MQKIAVQGQAMRCALLGVKLCRKNVIPRHGTRKKSTVVSLRRNMGFFKRSCIKAMHKVKTAAIWHARPDRMRLGLQHLVPAHLRHFEAAAIGLGAALQVKFDHFAANQTQTRRVTFLTVVEQHLHAHADAKQRFFGRRVKHRFEQTRLAQLGHAVAHRALAGQHHAVRVAHNLRTVSYTHLTLPTNREV